MEHVLGRDDIEVLTDRSPHVIHAYTCLDTWPHTDRHVCPCPRTVQWSHPWARKRQRSPQRSVIATTGRQNREKGSKDLEKQEDGFDCKDMTALVPVRAC